MTILVPPMDTLRTPTIDLSVGGQQGLMQNPQQWTSSANYVRQKIIAVLIAEPLLMHYMDNPDAQIAALKSLIELMPQKIDGLNSSVTWEYDGPNVGHAGEKFESVTKASRAVSAPSIEWSERYGMAIARFMTELGRQIILDPDLDHPAIVSSPAYIAAHSPPILPEHQAMTVLFIEPDVTMTNVTNAWLCTNMMPRSGGDILGSKEMAGTNSIVPVTIEYTAFTLTSKPVYVLAKNYLNSLKLNDMKPLDVRAYYDAISENVDAVQNGFAKEITDAVTSG